MDEYNLEKHRRGSIRRERSVERERRELRKFSSLSYITDSIRNGLDIPEHSTFLSYISGKPKLNSEDRLVEFDLDMCPHMRYVAEWIDSPEIDWVYLLCASQTSKTTMQMLLVDYWSKGDPSRCLWACSSQSSAKKFVKDRLRPFLHINAGSQEKIKKMGSAEYIEVGNMHLTIGWATSEDSMRSTPAKYIIGDEIGIWKFSVSLLQKRSRTYAGSGERKGLFATTPPRSEKHHSWEEIQNTDFYQIYAKCQNPDCENLFPYRLEYLKWDGKREDGSWDFRQVRDTARMECPLCHHPHNDRTKRKAIIEGKLTLVDPLTQKPIEDEKRKRNRKVSLHVPAFYSFFTSFGDIACMFLAAKSEGVEALKVFIMDELAEIPYDIESTSRADVVILRSMKGKYNRFSEEFDQKEINIANFPVITCGVDVQRTGQLYCTVIGWEVGNTPRPYILDYCVLPYIGMSNAQRWEPLLKYLKSFPKMNRVFIDSSDGVVTDDVFDFSQKNPTVLFPIKDVGKGAKNIRRFRGQKSKTIYFHIGSRLIKDEFLFWQETRNMVFPQNTEDEYFESLCSEYRIVEKKEMVWKQKKSGTPNHYFSSFIYACGAMEEFRFQLVDVGLEASINRVYEESREGRKFSKGVDIWS